MSVFFKRFFIITVLLIILAGFFTWKWVFQEQDKSVSSGKADMLLTATVLVNDFISNENQANIKYLNKIIAVHGTISQISEDDKELTVTLKKDKETSGVACGFDKSVVKKSEFKIGDAITVKDVCSGYLMHVVLNRCALVK